MNESSPPALPPSVAPRSSSRHTVLVVLCVLFGLAGAAAASATWWYHHNFEAAPFKPVNLSLSEQETLKGKLATLEGRDAELQALPASDPAKTIVISEREINGWLAAQEGLGDRVKFHMNHDTIGATILVPVEDGVEFVGGKTLRIKVTFNTKLDPDHQLNFSLADVSVGGISLPNAWLANAKGLNLLADNGPGSPDATFLKQFAAGIKDFRIRNGEMRVVLND